MKSTVIITWLEKRLWDYWKDVPSVKEFSETLLDMVRGNQDHKLAGQDSGLRLWCNVDVYGRCLAGVVDYHVA